MPKGQYTRKPRAVVSDNGPVGHERQGVGYDPYATGHELQGRAVVSEPAPDIAPVVTETRVDAVRAEYVAGGEVASSHEMDNTNWRRAQAAELLGNSTAPEISVPEVLANPALPAHARAYTETTREAFLKPPAENFDAWASEEPAIVPANDRVTQMVREWGGVVTVGEHNVTWLPSPDGSKIVVTLITPHGTSEMTGDAGAWTEGDIARALGEMRAALRV